MDLRRRARITRGIRCVLEYLVAISAALVVGYLIVRARW
jgi:hypothetical protein